jgi:hypothetical protein
MRAPLISLLISAAGLAAGGCASSPPQEEPPVTFTDRACSGAASDPLHLTTNKTVADRGDPEIESILTQRGDPRLVWVNRQMYQTLHALDVELRREQRVAACERSQSGLQTLEAQAGGGANRLAGSGASGMDASGGGTAGGSQGGAVTLATADVEAAAMPSVGANGAAVTAISAASPRSALIRKSSLSSASSGGNGATMPKVVAGSDNDIVARRLRKAAEQETDPALRQKLWKEYADYRQGIAAK